MQDYIHEREIKGICTGEAKTILSNFECYSASVGYSCEHISREHYHNWIDSLEGNEAHKSLYIRGVILFAKYLNLRGKISFVGMHPPYKSDFTPYIYSEEEIATLFSTVDKWRDYSINPGSIALVMPTLLRLIYSTGMRIGEALSITNIDVDFTRHSICLRKTKNNHERYCAITPTMEIVIKEYIRYRNMLPVAGVDAPHALLFCNNIGGKVNAKAVRVRFHNILIASGFKVTPSGYLPRIHDPAAYRMCAYHEKNDSGR